MSKHLHNISAVLSAGKFVHLSNFYIDYLPHWNALFILYCHPLHPALLPVSFLRSLPVNSTVVLRNSNKKLYSYVTNKNRVGDNNRGSKYAPEKESKGTKMKYEIVGIEHAVGDFTPTSGRNANTVQHYDVYRLHTLKNSKDAYGQITAVVRATPDQMGQIVADLGGNIVDVPGHVLDMEVRNSFGKINLTDYEVVR